MVEHGNVVIGCRDNGRAEALTVALCPATYGAYVSIRDQSPAILAYFEQQAATDGALTPATNGTSGFNELALVYKPDVKNNSHPIYPGTPGHFFCT